MFSSRCQLVSGVIDGTKLGWYPVQRATGIGPVNPFRTECSITRQVGGRMVLVFGTSALRCSTESVAVTAHIQEPARGRDETRTIQGFELEPVSRRMSL